MDVGAKAKLPCYANTDKRAAESNVIIRWEKDLTLVVKLEDGETKFGAGYEGRVSVSEEDYIRGDLSLNIDDVQPSDAGSYRCSAPNGKPRYPEIIALTVRGCYIHINLLTN